jgi:hypothetical protein
MIAPWQSVEGHCSISGQVVMKILRTPDERFAGLAGYPFEPRYV